MSTDIDGAIERARSAGSSGPEGFIGTLAQRVGIQASSGAVFGQAVSQGGVTVVPVAKVRWGFGGGSGSGEDTKGDLGAGAGGGGGVMAAPLGFIEIKDGRAEFRRVKDPASLLPLIVGSAFAFWVFTRALRGLFR